MSPNRVFAIGDTHFRHGNIIKFEPIHRPFKSIEEHDEELIKRWNATVRPQDTVWHLGDFGFGRDSIGIARRLNGIKHLVLGNHDQYGLSLYIEAFNKVVPYAKIQNCILSHIPVHPCQMGRYRGNIHGHMHSGKVDDERYVNVSCEHINLTPILLDTVINKFPKFIPPVRDRGAD